MKHYLQMLSFLAYCSLYNILAFAKIVVQEQSTYCLFDSKE